MTISLLAAVLLSIAPTVAPTTTPLPGDSLYLVDDGFQDQTGAAVHLEDWRGHRVLLAMFYARCPQACPLLISDIQRVLSAVPPAERARVKIVLVTLDPERDTAAFLQETLKSRGLPAAQWTLLRTDEATTRTLAAVLGVRYRDGEDGAIDHTSQIALLDRQGRRVATRAAIGSDVASFVAAIVDAVPMSAAAKP